MTESRPTNLDLKNVLREVQQFERETVSGGELDPALAALRQWQSNRLAMTYGDLSADPRYRAVIQFFLEDIYAARDFAQRNHDMERMYELLRRVAPEPIVRPLLLTVDLHKLTEHLDNRLLEVLKQELGMELTLTAQMYAEAYPRCKNYDERVRQIELICEIGKEVHRAVHVPFSGTILKAGLAALRGSGWGDLGGVMERGYKVFKPIRNADALLRVIHDRELAILDRIYAGHPNPFDLTGNNRQSASKDGASNESTTDRAE